MEYVIGGLSGLVIGFGLGFMVAAHNAHLAAQTVAAIKTVQTGSAAVPDAAAPKAP